MKKKISSKYESIGVQWKELETVSKNKCGREIKKETSGRETELNIRADERKREQRKFAMMD